MNPKEVKLHLSADINPKYRDFVIERNQNLGLVAAEILGIPYGGEIDNSEFKGETYVMPSKEFTSRENSLLAINSASEIYGAVVDDLLHGSKGILHQSLGIAPEKFSARFAHQISDLVLPGYTVFEDDSAMEAYNRLSKFSPVRLKDPLSSDGANQFRIDDSDHLRKVLRSFNEKAVNQYGLILESQVNNPVNISAGEFELNGTKYGLLAHQHTSFSETQDMFLGGRVIVGRGGLSSLLAIRQNTPEEADAIQKAIRFFDNLDMISVLSRGSVDVLSGQIGEHQISGIVDITLRPGGYTPVELMAADYLQNSGDQLVEGIVRLDYAPTQQPFENTDYSKVFLDSHLLRITANLLI